MPASMKQIKGRIQATQKTSQITKAMNMVSASKMKRAERLIRQFSNFTEKVGAIMGHLIASDDGDLRHPLLEVRPVASTLFVVVTSDRGLAGPYNSNVLKEMMRQMKQTKQPILLTIGKKAQGFMRSRNLSSINPAPFLHRDEVNFGMVKVIVQQIAIGYEAGEFDEVKIIYSHYINTLSQEVRVHQLLPVVTTDDDTLSAYEFEGGPQAIINQLLPVYIENMIYGALLDSKASEHASRMTAMQSATDNAKDIIRQLNLYYNRARQASVTSELTDIIGGANAVGGNQS
jgi:F-type H+-transporting ATPase subunit gamma